MKTFQTDLEVCISHLDKLGEYFKVHFGDVDIMHVSEWPVTPFSLWMHKNPAQCLCASKIRLL